MIRGFFGGDCQIHPGPSTEALPAAGFLLKVSSRKCSQTVRNSPQTIGPTMNPIGRKGTVRQGRDQLNREDQRHFILFVSSDKTLAAGNHRQVPTTARTTASKVAVQMLCPVTNRMITACTHTRAAPSRELSKELVMISSPPAAPSIPALPKTRCRTMRLESRQLPASL